MIISHKHKFIFIRPKKVAGTSILLSLAKHCGEEDIMSKPHKYTPNIDEEEYEIKQTCKWIEEKHVKPEEIKSKYKEEWDNYFKFTIVRNPWDCVVSGYLYSIKVFPPVPSFTEFVKGGKWESNEDYYFMKDGLSFDYCMRFENLEKDWKELCSKLKIPPTELYRVKTKVRKDRKHYSTYYNKETEEIIRRECYRGIEHFGYEFESPETP